jgi:hypothetical protein
VYIALSCLAIVIGVGLIVVSVVAMLNGSRSLRWPRCECEILAFHVDEYGVDSGRTFRFNVVYEYTYGGHEYVGNRIYFGDHLEVPFREWAMTLSHKYAPGYRASVSYNPSRPAESVLEAGIHPAVVYACALGIVFVVVGATLIAVR